MNPTVPPDQAMTPGRIRQKADILETNLYKSITKEDNPITARFRIDRTTYPDPVIIKALIQLFPRLNIKAPKILRLIRTLLIRPLSGNQPLTVQKELLNLSDSKNMEMDHLTIQIHISISSELLEVEIGGTPPVPGSDSGIKEAFFDYQSCPGLVTADGAIDFREINKYPIVKAGDNLFFITHHTHGRSGIQYDGKVIPTSSPTPMAITIRDGVERVNSTNEEDRGYFLRANKTGVVVLTRSGDDITDIEIRDALDIQRLDYSTGNIGTQFICPISMKIDTICAGFKIRARGAVAVRELEGGEIETDSHAIVRSAHPGSQIKAAGDIVVHRARRALLSAAKGRVMIGEELMETQVDGRGILFEKPRGILSGSTLDAHQISLKNIYFNGENKIFFGHRLFKEKNAMILARGRLKEKGLNLKTQQDQAMENFNKELKQLSRILKTHPKLRDTLKTFILSARQMDYDSLYHELDIIGKTMNTKQVIVLVALLDQLRKILKEISQAETESRQMLDRIIDVQNKLFTITLDIDGFLRRASTLKIFTPKKEGEEKKRPALTVESKFDRNTRIKIQGKYTHNQGFVIVQE